MANIEDQYVSLDAGAIAVGPGQSVQMVTRKPSDLEKVVLLGRLHIVSDFVDALSARVHAVCLASSDGGVDAAQCLATYRKVPGTSSGLLLRDMGKDERILADAVRLETFRSAGAPLVLRSVREGFWIVRLSNKRNYFSRRRTH